MRASSRWWLVIAPILALTLPATTAHAYGVAGAGGKLGIASPEDLDDTVMLGGHVEFERAGTRLHLMPNILYWRANRFRDFNPNFDVYYHFGAEGRTVPYLGGGLGLNLWSSEVTDRSDTDLGANLIGGVRFPGGPNHFFLEGRYTASDVSHVAVLGGITFGSR